MSKENEIAILKYKIGIIESRGDFEKRAGVLRKLHRRLRKLEA